MTTTASRVSGVAAAEPSVAQAHFERRLAVETDCSDVHDDLARHGAEAGFVVVDARSADDYAAGHVPGAISLPHRTITDATVASLPAKRLLVTYCWGPHCNAATKAAAKLAALGFSVKEMLGGFEYWCREGYDTERGAAI
jgi:rhodanese-related sulfurtransferase